MPPSASRQTSRVVLAYSSVARDVRDRVVRYVETTWRNLGSYADADIDRFVNAVVPVVQGGQRRLSTLTDAYLAQLATEILGEPVRPVGVPPAVISSEAMRGVSTADVYARMGPTVWYALSQGDEPAMAIGKGLDRAVKTAQTDLQLARTHTAQYVCSRDARIAGYRRIPTGGKVCALCAIASTQRYHSEDLMPIHPGCSCDVEPIYGTEDPGRVIEPDRLEGIHQEIEARLGRRTNNAAELRDLIVVHDHGEIGPVLAVRGQHFTGPNDI